MSISSAAGASDFGQMANLISDSATVKQNLDNLTIQISTGLVSNTYAGLGSGAAVSLNLEPQIAALTTWQNNINQAASSMQVTQTAMTQMQQIAANFLAQTGNLEGSDASEVDSVAASARQALMQVADLLDTQDGNAYVFSGQDSGNPPVPQPNSILSSQFYTQIAAQVGQLGTQGAATTAANALAIAGSSAPGLSPFATYLSQLAGSAQPPAIQIGDGQTASVGLLASSNSAVTSTGVPTTSTG